MRSLKGSGFRRKGISRRRLENAPGLCRDRSQHAAKSLLLILIDVELLTTICVILPPAPSILQEASSDACVYTRVASAAERLRCDGQSGSYQLARWVSTAKRAYRHQLSESSANLELTRYQINANPACLLKNCTLMH